MCICIYMYMKRTWRRQVDEESTTVSQSREDALCRSSWSDDVNLIATRLW